MAGPAPWPLLSLTDAALRQAVGPAVRLVAMPQLARAHALAGQVAEADSAMAQADHLADQPVQTRTSVRELLQRPHKPE